MPDYQTADDTTIIELLKTKSELEKELSQWKHNALLIRVAAHQAFAAQGFPFPHLALQGYVAGLQVCTYDELLRHADDVHALDHERKCGLDDLLGKDA